MGRHSPVALVESYLDRLREIQGTRKGTPEQSYRAALENLLNAIGRELDPPVQATHELADAGQGRPDFGFFELKSGNDRGVVEVKSFSAPVPHTASGEQVSCYAKQHGVVLVTNYRDFLLVTRGDNGSVNVEGRYAIAADADAFARTKASALAKLRGDGLVDFLIGVMKRAAPITRPRDLADDVARHAREAKRRLEHVDMSALAPLKEAMEKALGLHFAGKEGEDFFRSSLVQTLFYGLFSGWMLWRQNKHQAGAFEWQDASEHLALPLIGDLYEEIARPRKLSEMHLREPLEWATSSLRRVAEAEFFKNFDASHAITLFYEPFLQAFDPDLRKELGVWYTPPEIVQYQVGRVDQLLRSELGIENGLADDQVFVLDPCCGTGSYLIEVAKRIHATLLEQGHGDLAAGEVKKALTSRIFGFEILPAPYVVSHLQMGVMLREMGTKLAPTQRAGVFLTNALTGWEPPTAAKETLAFHFLIEEQDAAARVKREAPILVILGNPPYNGFTGVAEDEEANLMQPYYDGLREYGVQVRGLNDLYVRFFRLAERRIAEVGNRGIVCFISNYSWLDGQSHPVMRDRLLERFEKVWIDNCNGDKYKTGKRTPDGRPDQSMFTTDAQPIGIQIGTAIATLVNTHKNEPDAQTAEVQYRDLWGTANEKRAALVISLKGNAEAISYQRVTPTKAGRYALLPGDVYANYHDWPDLADIGRQLFSGIKTARDEFLIDVDQERIEKRMRAYFDLNVSDDEMREIAPVAVTDASRFPATEVRTKLRRRGYQPGRLVRIAYRPFDDRWLYWELEHKLLDERRADFAPHVIPQNLFLFSSNEREKLTAFDRVFVSRLPGELHLLRPDANPMPLLLAVETPNGTIIEPNVAEPLLAALCHATNVPLHGKDGHSFTEEAFRVAEHLFFHILAVLWSPAYRKENEAALRQDWPRVPIPAGKTVLESSAALGRRVADLLLPDRDVSGVTTGKLDERLKNLAVPKKVGGGTIEEPRDTAVDAGWGFRGQKNAVMCGKGSVVPSPADPENAVDVYINDHVYWSNVPKDVWTMTIGGYPVVKKWLSYREHKVLRRALKTEELAYVTQVVRRLKALLLLAADLDANYRAAAAAEQVKLTKD